MTIKVEIDGLVVEYAPVALSAADRLRFGNMAISNARVRMLDGTKAAIPLIDPTAAALLSQQLIRFDECSRALCIAHALHCFDHPRRKGAPIYAGYVAAVAHENMRRMKKGPCLLRLASKKQFSRIVTILQTGSHRTPADAWRKMVAGVNSEGRSC